MDQVIANGVRLGTPGPAATKGALCLSEATFAALADGAIDEQARIAAVSHLATCGWCRGAFASLTRALQDPELAREITASKRRRRRGLLVIAVPLAAAAILVVLVLPRRPGTDTREHRAPSSAAAAPVPASPIGLVARPRVLTWTSVTGADKYRVVLFDASGRVMYEAQHSDTTLALPDSIAFVPGLKYLWKVDARLGSNRWSASPLIEFTIGDGRRYR